MSWFTENKDGITLTVRVIPRASRSEIVGEHGDALKIKLASPPVDGAANEELIKLLSKRLDVPRSDIEIVAGHTAKLKRLSIRGVTPDKLKALTE